MEIQFIKMNPSQNMTILVETPLPRERYQAVASALMEYHSVCGEQVGFIEKPAGDARARLQMMGGEFCGNATMALASLLVWRDKESEGSELVVPLEVSGAEDVITCRVVVEKDAWRGTVRIPPPERLESLRLSLDGRDYEVDCVYFQGITHMILPREQVEGAYRVFAEKALQQWGKSLPGDACGLILYEPEPVSIEPLVAVWEASSMVWERSCGSGTAAVGALLSRRSGGPVKVDVSQPGGVITVETEYSDGRVISNAITGTVRIAAYGTAIL